MRVTPSRGHYCLYEARGETCPGPSGCSTVAAEVTDNPCDKGGIREGFRCADCGRWSERAEDLLHADRCLTAPKLPPPPKPRWNALLGRRV